LSVGATTFLVAAFPIPGGGRTTVPLPLLYSSMLGTAAKVSGASAVRHAAATVVRRNALRESSCPPGLGEAEHRKEAAWVATFLPEESQVVSSTMLPSDHLDGTLDMLGGLTSALRCSRTSSSSAPLVTIYGRSDLP